MQKRRHAEEQMEQERTKIHTQHAAALHTAQLKEQAWQAREQDLLWQRDASEEARRNLAKESEAAINAHDRAATAHNEQ